jgi:hypothetical protein
MGCASPVVELAKHSAGSSTAGTRDFTGNQANNSVVLPPVVGWCGALPYRLGGSMFKWLFEKAIGFEGENLPFVMNAIGIISIVIPVGFAALVITCAVKYLRS